MDLLFQILENLKTDTLCYSHTSSAHSFHPILFHYTCTVGTRSRILRKCHPEGIVVILLYYGAAHLCYYPVVTQMVGDVKVIISSFIITSIN
jgi:hypothetical protein